jgi:hypothetical protein
MNGLLSIRARPVAGKLRRRAAYDTLVDPFNASRRALSLPTA